MNTDDLPPGWAKTTLGDVVENKVAQLGPSHGDEFTYIDISGVDNTLKRITDPKTLPRKDAPNRARQNVEPADVLVSMTRPNLNAVAVVTSELAGAVASTGFDVLRCRAIEPDWLFLAVQSSDFVRAMCKVVQGALYPAVRPQDIRSYPLPLPPLAEQRRIVARLEELFAELDEAVAELERVRANLKRYRASVLKAAVSGELTADWRATQRHLEPASVLLERILQDRRAKWQADQLARFAADQKPPPKNWQAKYAEPSTPDTATLPALPDGWCWANIDQLLVGIESGKSFKCQTRRANHDEWAVIKVSAMTWGTFLEDEQKALQPNATFDRSDEVRPGDLLLSRCNTTELVGATVLVGPCRPKLLLSDKSLRLLLVPGIDRRWFHKALSSSVIRRQLSAMATGTSDSMRNVSQEKIVSVVVPLPPRAEQEAIVAEVEAMLSNVIAAQEAVSANLTRAARLRQSILKEAFAGRLVPQDPADEPASALLERIKAAKPTTTPAKNPAAAGVAGTDSGRDNTPRRRKTPPTKTG